VFTSRLLRAARFTSSAPVAQIIWMATLHRLREPEMDGIELARRATEIDPDLKVMFITGFAAVALNPDSDAPKDAKVLSKPFHLRDLVNEVEKMLAAA
jgi:DNA-binding NtrC family response regulator